MKWSDFTFSQAIAKVTALYNELETFVADKIIEITGLRDDAQGSATNAENAADTAIEKANLLVNSVSIVDEGDDFYTLVAFHPAELTEETVTVEGYDFETILISQE